MLRKFSITYPYLFVLYYVLNFFAYNPIYIELETVIFSIGIFFAIALLFYVASRLLLKNSVKASIGSLYISVLFFSYIFIEEKIVTLFSTIVPRELIKISVGIIALIFVLFILYWLKKTTSQLNVITSFLSIFLVILLSFPIYTFVEYSCILGKIQSSEQKTVAVNIKQSSPAPNIYHIVLDGYGRDDVLNSEYNLDNSDFINYLKEKSFTIKHDCYANYVWTPCSVTSTLTMNYLEEGNLTISLSSQLLRNKLKAAGMGVVFSNLGYKYVEVASPVPTTSASDILQTYEKDSRAIISMMIYYTPLRYFYTSISSDNDQKAYDYWRKKMESTFSSLEEVSENSDTPLYVYCHILLPHPPFVYDEYGNPINPTYPPSTNDASKFLQSGGTVEEYRKQYKEQLLYTNTRIEQVIDNIIANNDRPTLILLASDHGPRVLIDEESLGNSQLYEAYPMFFAYRAPAGDDVPLDRMRTPVNMYRIILNHYLGTDYPLLPDKSYYSRWSHPMQFTEVTDRVYQ